MNPGRDLDALIAEKVMGFQVIRGNPEAIHGPTPDYFILNPFRTGVLSYSTDIALAWEVLEEAQNSGDPLGRMWKPEVSHGGKGHRWRCEFTLSDDNAGDDITYYFAEADTAPEAICLAALKMFE